VFSNYSITLLKKLGLNSITISPELEKDEINNICNNASEYPTELIVYGKIPVMTSNYCLLGKTNKCYPECDKKCLNQNCTYYLKDRMDFSFRIVPDNISTITTIYNSKTLSINPNAFNTTFARIDILDENNIETIQEIINYVKSGQRFEGNQYTNGRT
jgi:putative protease